MTFQDFVSKYSGVGLDFDLYYGDQCVDLAQFYNRDVLNNEVRFTGNAVDIYGQQLDKFDWIANTPAGIPAYGDVVIWDGSLNGGPGHIAIFIQGDANQFDSFDQNWPTNSPCHTQHHNYNYVLGWGHPKGANMDDIVAGLKADLQEAHDTLAKANTTITAYEAKMTDQQTQIDLLTKQVADLQKQPVDTKPVNLSGFTVGQLLSAAFAKLFNIK